MTAASSQPDVRIQVGVEAHDKTQANLSRLTLALTKAFYGDAHFIVVDYIQRNGCIKEEDLRQLIHFDHRFLRSALTQLKHDKFVKERLVSEGQESRARKVSYFHINYRSMINVVKYKIDHMRQRLEVKDKNEVQRGSYRCMGCRYHYDAMEMDKIFDMRTQELRCWKCGQLVEIDDKIGPVEDSRSSITLFNEQMAPLLSLLQSLDDTYLARYLLEPPIKNCDESLAEAGQGEVIGTGAHDMVKPSNSDITISFMGEEQIKTTKTKEAVPWLQNNLIEKEIRPGIEAGNVEENGKAKSEIHKMLINELEEEPNGDFNGKVKNFEREGSYSDEDGIFVQGVRYDFEEITPQLVQKMSEAEKQAYVKRVQEDIDF